MLPFKKKSNPLVGIDISATAIKLLELSKSGDRYRVESYAVEPVPANSVVDKNITDMDAVGEAIGKAVKRSGTKLKTAAAAVAGSSVITKIITMPLIFQRPNWKIRFRLKLISISLSRLKKWQWTLK